MGVKNISIKDRVYELLKRVKGSDESFSDVIEKLITKREVNLKEFYGCLKHSEVLDEVKLLIEKARRDTRLRV